MNVYPVETGNFKLDGGAMFEWFQNRYGIKRILLIPITCVIGQCDVYLLRTAIG